MHTSVAVFVALTVIYAGTLVLPYDLSAKTMQFAAQAATIACAVATFFVLKSSKMGVGPVALVLAAATSFVALAGLAAMTCPPGKCQKYRTLFVANSLLFSTSIMTGSAAFLAYTVGSVVGLPAWAAIVASVVLTPLYIVYGMPVVVEVITRMTELRE